MKKITKFIIAFALATIIILAFIAIIFMYKQKSVKQVNVELQSESKLYEYKSFTPTFENNYDYTQDMTYLDKIYYMKINNYEEYSYIKTKWDIIEMEESDFENYFMVITATENISMEGLTVDSIFSDDTTLYITLVHFEDDIDYDPSSTCISYKISRKLERNNISVTKKETNDNSDSNNNSIASNLDTTIFLVDMENYSPGNTDKNITESQAKEIAQYGFNESSSRIASEGTDNIENETVEIKTVSPNNYFTKTQDQPDKAYLAIRRDCYIVTRQNELGNGVSVYIDYSTGLIIGGTAFGD